MGGGWDLILPTLLKPIECIIDTKTNNQYCRQESHTIN